MPTPTDLFISEYIEGSSNNKAIEIYNGTGAAIDLAAGGYEIFMSFNGGSSTTTIALTGTVAAGDVFVLAHGSAVAAILDQADQRSATGASWFNGDDAIVLRKAGGTVVDVLGQVGIDPGSEWGTGNTSTADNTIRRKSDISAGDTNGSDAFDPAVQWDGFAINTFDGLGSHTFTGGGGGTPSETLTLSTPDASAAEGGDTGTFRITRSGPTTADLVISYSVGGTASAADYSETLTGTVTIPAGQSFVELTVTPVDDLDVESPETLSLTLSPLGGFTLAGSPAAVTIADNDVGVTRISAIQGSTGTSPLAGSTVTLEAIVVADYQTGGLGGFFVQEEDADTDGNALTSEGLFIFNSAINVNVGDKVRITGQVIEFTSSGITLTEISPASSITVVSSGNTLPSATVVNLPVATLADLEALEGMRVTIPETLTVTDTGSYTDGLQRFGEVVLAAEGGNNEPGTDARLDQFTQFHAPSVAGNAAYQAQNALRSIVLDDGLGTSYPGTWLGRDGAPLSASNTLRGGDTITGLTGVLDQRFGAYRIQPTEAVDVDPTNARPTAPADVGGAVQVAAMNVLNYFNGPSFPTSRGADSATELTRQQDKIVSAILGTGAEIVGLMEIENDGFGPSSAIQTLVNALNAATAPGTWAFVNPGSETTGTDEIMVGLIYQPAKVTPVGAAATLSPTQDAGFSGFSTANRPALAQTFRINDTDGLITPVVNHLKSKGSSAGGSGDADSSDGQAASNGTRTRAAEALVDWLATDPTGQGDTDYLILGDLNAYAQEDPLKAIERGADGVAGTADDWGNLIANSTYSYSFDAQWGALDHALGSASILSQVTGATKWHINADEPVLLDYNVELGSGAKPAGLYGADPYRSSDHDPVVVGLNPGFTLNGSTGSDAALLGKAGNDTINGLAGRDLIAGGAGNDRINGGAGRDLLSGDAGADRFIYSSLLDAGDQIIGFEPGTDRLDISALLAATGYTGSTPVEDGRLYTVVAGAGAGAQTAVRFDPDGAGPQVALTLVQLIGVAVPDAHDLLGAGA